MSIDISAAGGDLLFARIEGPGNAAGTETVFQASSRPTEQSDFGQVVGQVLGTVIVTGGDLSPGGDFDVHLTALSDAAVTIDFQRMSVDGVTPLQTISIDLVADQPIHVLITVKDLLNNQNFRVILGTAQAGGDVCDVALRVQRR